MRSLMLATACAFAMGCDRRTDPCLQDEIFCSSPSNWKEMAENRPTSDLMRIQVINWNYYRPPSETFARILGQRGEESLKILIMTMREDYRYQTDLFFMPIVSHVIEAGFPFCNSQYPAMLVAEVRDRQAKKQAVLKIKEVCEGQ